MSGPTVAMGKRAGKNEGSMQPLNSQSDATSALSFLPERRMARHRWALAIAPRRCPRADRPLSIWVFRYSISKWLAPAGRSRKS